MQSKVYKKKTWKQRILGTTIYQKIFRVYLCITLIGAGILSLPASHTAGKSLNFFEAFFTAISAFTNTGLTLKPTYETFNFFGQLIILILIQVGGMGFLTFLIFLWGLFGKKKRITMEYRLFLHWERGSCNKVESLDAVKTGITVLLIAEIIGAYVLTIFFYSSSPSSPSSNGVVDTKGHFWKSLWYGIFHAVSAANNAGFDLLGKHSLVPYRNGANNFLSVVFLLESILGGIGYPIFHEIKNYFKAKKSGEVPEFSLFFNIGILSYFLIALVGACAAICFEVAGSSAGIFQGSSSTSSSQFTWDTNANKAFADKVWNIIYLSFSSRSAGFSSIDISELTESTRCLLSVLMFIGANPASTGGGVRTVTLFIILSRFWYTARGRKYLSIFQKTISQKIVDDALQVFILSTILVIFSSFVLILSATNGTMNDAIFEATSAFGTAGFTSGLTGKTNFVGQIALIVLMFVGQLGVSNALISITDLKSKPKDCEYLSADLRIM